MSDFPPEPAPSWGGVRDRIQAALGDLKWADSAALRLDSDYQRRILAGALRRAFGPQLAIMDEQAATIGRVRALVRRHRHDGTIPLRELEAALYGDENQR